MINAAEAVVWVNRRTHQVMVRTHAWGVPEDRAAYDGDGHWSDPIGAAYAQWQRMSDAQRVQLMTETCLDLAAQGFPLPEVLKAFAEVEEFRALGSESIPMCRALTWAMVGRCLEPNTMTFEELIEHYGAARAERGVTDTR